MDRPENVLGRELYVVSGRTQSLPQVKAHSKKRAACSGGCGYSINTPFGPY